jgi:hypothetical protein
LGSGTLASESDLPNCDETVVVVRAAAGDVARSRPQLYAAMFVLALAMELYGTWLGNWKWRALAPWLGLLGGRSNPASWGHLKTGQS